MQAGFSAPGGASRWRRLRHLRQVAAVLGGLCCAAAQAQFTHVPTPLPLQESAVSSAADDTAYRQDAARHIYQSYPLQIWRGKLRPQLYAIAVLAVTVDADGRIVATEVQREPAYAKEVVPWLLRLLERAQPLPRPAATGRATYVDVWLVDQSGRFQLDTLTEGQLDQ
ncbi:MAG: hypothetical protein AB9M53_03535 [Leptothrix sp. (in: b-proteobacteria)]